MCSPVFHNCVLSDELANGENLYLCKKKNHGSIVSTWLNTFNFYFISYYFQSACQKSQKRKRKKCQQIYDSHEYYSTCGSEFYFNLMHFPFNRYLHERVSVHLFQYKWVRLTVTELETYALKLNCFVCNKNRIKILNLQFKWTVRWEFNNLYLRKMFAWIRASRAPF